MEEPIGKYLRARRPFSALLTIAIISPEYVCVCVCVFLKSLYSQVHLNCTVSAYKLVPEQIWHSMQYVCQGKCL
jgi:hypothetical protein